MKGRGSKLGKELEPRISKQIVQKVGNRCKIAEKKGTQFKRRVNKVEGWMEILVGH